ncbi:hypothetical protein AZL_011290 [Azospirillum sp. B510]|nr:hypothetical protein AZL_011290 [Azospirillum sp. B510]
MLTSLSIASLTGPLDPKAPVPAECLPHLGHRTAVAQSRMTKQGKVVRTGHSVYLLPVTSRFDTRTPSVEQAAEALAAQRGAVTVSSDSAAASRVAECSEP